MNTVERLKVIEAAIEWFTFYTALLPREQVDNLHALIADLEREPEVVLAEVDIVARTIVIHRTQSLDIPVVEVGSVDAGNPLPTKVAVHVQVTRA